MTCQNDVGEGKTVPRGRFAVLSFHDPGLVNGIMLFSRPHTFARVTASANGSEVVDIVSAAFREGFDVVHRSAQFVKQRRGITAPVGMPVRQGMSGE